jgi:phage baseplate assembly protein gpV
VSDVIGVLRAIVREELGRRRLPELGTVTTVHAHADGDDGNHQVDVKLRASGVELKRVPVAVARLGWSALPNKDDLVLVCFLDGDLSAPVVAGCLYDDQAHPPVAAEHEVVYQPPDEESSDTRRFHLELPSGATLTIKDEEVSLTLGDTTVTAAKDGDVSISAKGNIQLKAEGDVEIQATGDLKLSADGKLSLKGMNASLEGQSETKVKGAQVALAGMTQFSAS